MTAPPSQNAYSDALPAGTRLMWYEIQRVLGRGGFAITYLATDRNLEQAVAIKEYLPRGLAQRSAAGVQASAGSERVFNWGRERFLSEARTLARFKHPNIVRVVTFFEADNTAYLVMDFEAGQSLAGFLAEHPAPEVATLLAIVCPLMDGLEQLHRAGFIHRDVKPENIYLRRDGSPVLLDFGAARQALGGQTQNLTALLSPGYAPLEQYFSEKDRQGPWSDIYALAAVMYRAVCGRKPPEATLRSSALLDGQADPMVPAAKLGLGRYPSYLLEAIDCGLRLREKDRPQSLAEWRDLLAAPTAVPEAVAALDLAPLDFGLGAAGAATRPPQPPAVDISGRSDTWPTRRQTAVPPAREEAAPAELFSGAAPLADPLPLVDPLPLGQAPAPAEAAPAMPAAPENRRYGRLFLVLLGIGLAAWAYQASVRRPPTPPVAAAAAPMLRSAVQEQLDSSMEACRPDAEAYCRGIMPGDGRLAACMRDNLRRLSPACRSLVEERLRGPGPRN